MDRVGVARDADDKIRITQLDRARSASQRNDAAGTSEWNLVEPARADAVMLGQARRALYVQRYADDREPIDVALAQSAPLQDLRERSSNPPLSGSYGIALVGNRHWRGDDHAVIGPTVGSTASGHQRMLSGGLLSRPLSNGFLLRFDRRCFAQVATN